MGQYGVFEECMVGETFAFGCAGIGTAVFGTNLGVSWSLRLLYIRVIYNII